MNLHNALPLRLCIFLFVSRTYEVSFSTSYFLINLSNISDVFKVHLNLAIYRNPLQKIFPRIWKYNLVLLVNEKNLLFSGIVNSSQKQPPRGVFKKRCSENMQQIYRRTPMPKCDFNKVAKQLYWNHTSAWLFSCKISPYFQNNFSEEYLWVPASVLFTLASVFLDS